jgi:hypothetical protein
VLEQDVAAYAPCGKKTFVGVPVVRTLPGQVRSAAQLRLLREEAPGKDVSVVGKATSPHQTQAIRKSAPAHEACHLTVQAVSVP